MCIIAVKHAGVKIPDKEILMNCFDNNPDGAGLMIPSGGRVHILKGFMNFSDFHSTLQEVVTTEAPAVFHFRIGTHGANIPANTHPFPVSGKTKELKATDIYCKMGVAHNGIIRTVKARGGLSDTMQYIKDRLAPAMHAFPNMLSYPCFKSMLKADIDSKMCFLSGEGKITLIGEFQKYKGVYYSNDSYLSYDYPIGGYKKKIKEVRLYPLFNAEKPVIITSCYQPDKDVDYTFYAVDKEGGLYRVSHDSFTCWRVYGYTCRHQGGGPVVYDETLSDTFYLI